MIGLTFAGKHSFNDFQLVLNSRKINTPSKKKIKESIPGTSLNYDFSTVASGGEIVYNDRIINVKFTLLTASKAQLQQQFSKVVAWILDAGKSMLKFDDMPGVYFMAEIEDENILDEMNQYGEFTISFIAEPFKYGVDLISATVWDTFNFEEDKEQATSFDVAGSSVVSIYNPGRVLIPTIEVNANMSVIIGEYTLNLVPGITKDYGFKLQNGDNEITINGTGAISFAARKELI